MEGSKRNSRILIPDEIVMDILERLPVKTIVRCTALSKFWYSTITTPGLLKPHLKSSTSSSNTNPEQGHFLVMYTEPPEEYDDDDEDEENCFVTSEDSVFCEMFRIKFLANNCSEDIPKVGNCCNGVICLSDIVRKQNSIFLCNPSIRKLRCINPTPFELDDTIKKPLTSVHRAIGFCYDKFTDDYKVIVVDRLTCSDGTLNVMAEVYSLKTNSWKILAMRDYGFLSNDSNVSVNNATYWLRVPKKDEKRSVVSFDLSAEVFRKFDLPDSWEPDIYLLKYNGSPAILEEGDNFGDFAEVTIWTLKEYGEGSWNQEFTRVIKGSFYKPLDFTRSGKLLYWRINRDLSTWDPKSGKVVNNDGYSYIKNIVVEDYIESLILL